MSDQLIVSMRAETLLARLAGTADRLDKGMRAAVERLSIIVQTGVKEDKLTGQVLHVRTGTLRRSINRKVTQTSAGVFATVGTNVAYAGAHEYGFDGAVTVKSHTRRAALQMAAKRTQRVGKSEGTINVREFVRHMHMPERSFLRSELRDRSDEIRQSLRAAALEAIRP